MNLPAFCIKRPAFTIVISLVMIIVGIIGFSDLPVRWIPNINLPEVDIITSYPGANARLVERDVTKVLEDALSGISGIETLVSTSKQGVSRISIEFKLGQDINASVDEIRTAIERYRHALPKDVENPVVRKEDPDSSPMMFLAFSNKNWSERELSDYINKFIKPLFETIDGMGSVRLFGERITAMKISLDPAKMAAQHMTIDEVLQPLRDQNVSVPSGQIASHDRVYSIITETSLLTPSDFNNLILRSTNQRVVRLKDIGLAELGPENDEGMLLINGKPGIAVGFVAQSTANPLQVEEKIQTVLKELKKTLPQGMEISIPYNQSDYIRASLKSVYEAFAEAIVFVWIVILVFLCSFRATIIPIITIPVCLIATFGLIHFFHFSLNTITLMALVLAIGLVVDDAIVMLENIERHIEEGLSVHAAALKGSRQMIFPIIAMTLTLAAVYAPIAFTPGLLGVLFKEFTFTLAGAVIISGIVALTLSPMMCAYLLKQKTSNRFSAYSKYVLTGLQNQYQRLLVRLLQMRGRVLLGLLLIAIIGGVVYKYTPAELAPMEDMNRIEVYVTAPRSASYDYTSGFVKQLIDIYKQEPDIESSLAVMHNGAPAHAFTLLHLKENKSHTTAEIIKSLTEKVKYVTGVKVNISQPFPALSQFAGGDDGERVGLTVMTSSDYLRLQRVSNEVKEKLLNTKAFSFVNTRLRWDSEQFQVNVDKNKAADLNVSLPAITNTISTLVAGKTIGKTDDANIILKMDKLNLADPNVIDSLYVRNTAGNMIPLSQLVTLSTSTAPEVFHHNERLRADTIFADMLPEANLADTIALLQQIAKQTIPDDMKYTFTGEAKSFLDSKGKTAFTFLLALVFIYLVLVAQFESFIHPLIIMLTVPFAVVGAVLTLKLFGGSINVYSNIGLITLVGLIAKHGILITEFANHLRVKGIPLYEAVVEAALLRLRPILMTTAAMVLGALPLVLALGPGSESRQQIGLVITGGLIFGTFFSLIVIPVAYTYLAPLAKTRILDEDDIGKADVPELIND